MPISAQKSAPENERALKRRGIRRSLRFERTAKIVERAGSSEELATAGDELRVFRDEDLPGWAEVELLRVLLEELAMNAGPDETAICIDVDLGDASLGGRKIFVHVDAHGAGNLAASGVNPGHFVLRDRRGTMHDERVVGQTVPDFFEHIEVQGLTPLELEGAVAGTKGAGQRVTARLLHELLSLSWVGQAGVALFDDDIFFDATEHAEFGLDGDTFGVSAVNDPFGDRDVFLEGFVGSVDHDGTEGAGIDAIVAGLFVTVIQMDGINCVRVDVACSADNRLKHALVGVFAGSLGDLDDKRRLGIDSTLEEAHRLLGVVNIESTNGVFAVGVLEELCSSNDHVSVRKIVRETYE